MKTTTITQRDDILVSLCLSDIQITPSSFAEICELAHILRNRFRFYEIVLVANALDKEAFLPLLKRIPNLRLFTLREGLSTYRHRVIAASEAIGDVVVIASQEQFGSLDHLAMINVAADEALIVVGLRPDPKGFNRVLSSLLAVAGGIAGFRAALQDGPTIAIPRTLLNQLLEHSDPDLALRFIPRDPIYPVSTHHSKPGVTVPSETGAMSRRLELIEKLIIHMAPGVLLLVTLVSALLSFIGFLYAVYVIVVWSLVPGVAPGWLTISLMMSVISIFFGSTIFGLSVGLQRVLALLRRDAFESVAQEINKTDLFGHVAEDLNVDLHHGDGYERADARE